MPREQRRSKELAAYIRELRGDRTARSMAEAAGIAYSRWRQVESDKDVPPPETLWKMAGALGATASQIEHLFELAQFGEMFDQMSRIGQSRIPKTPGTAELGISADPTLNRESKAKLLDMLQMIRATQDE